MHEELIDNASNAQIKSFAKNALSMLKETNPKTYKDLETHLYKEIYGEHFCDWLLDRATSKMSNEDGTNGPHWTVEQTTSVAKSLGITLDNFNEYDWNYVMNMMYSDYYGIGSNDASFYAKMAKRFLMDKDGPTEGKALYYYWYVAKH